MDIRKYFNFGGSKPAKNVASPVNKTETLTNSKDLNNKLKSPRITEKNNNTVKLPKKEPEIKKDIPKSNDAGHEELSSESRHKKSNSVLGVAEKKNCKNDIKYEEKTERKELGKKKEVVKEKHESPKEREKKRKNNEQKQPDKTPDKTPKKLSAVKSSPKEDKVKDKSKADKKHGEEELNKKIKQKKTAVVDSDSDEEIKQKANIKSKHKQNAKKKPLLSESSDESDEINIICFDSDDMEPVKKGSSNEKKPSGLKKSGKLEKKSQHKRKRFKSESDDDFDIESVNEKHESPRPVKSSSKSKKIKKQISSDDEDYEDMTRRNRKKSKSMKNSNRISDSDSEKEVKSKTKRRKARSVFTESDEENRVSKSPIKNFFKPKMANEKNITVSKPHKSPNKAKVVSAADFFGSSSVQRVERKVSSPLKRKISESFEDEFHDDDDFAATLDLLDKQEAQVKKVKVDDSEKHKTPTKKETSPQKKTGSAEISESGIAGKLAKKIKMEKLETSKISPKKVDETLKISPKKAGETLKISPKKAGQALKKASETDTPSPNRSFTKVDIPETPVNKMQTDKSAYKAFLNREGPRYLGSKEIPQGADNCLEGLTFVITGILESIERDEAKSLVERYGGKVTTSLSGRTSYMVVGRDAGESKLKKAESLKTNQIDEDGLFDLIRKKPGKKSKYLINAEQAVKKENNLKKEENTPNKSMMRSPLKTPKKSPMKSPKKSPMKSPKKSPMKSQKKSPMKSQKKSAKSKDSDDDTESILWVDKYKPKSLKQIIGQNGDKSNAKKLLNWMKSWQSNRIANVKPSSNRFFGGNDTGAGMKAALLSGPPGVGKTTTAHLVCKEIGFSVVEMNASDTRSKSCLQSEVMTLLQNSSLVDFCGTGKSTSGKIKHCLIMDEVDGMAGNEDRGGMAELIQLIKSSKIPIICLCNDRQHPKIRSLVNHCFDLRFQRPRVEQIKAAMMTLAFKEGLKISPPALAEVILAANHDIRQVIHNLSVFTSAEKNLSYDDAKNSAQKAKKDTKLGPFEVCRQVFVGNEETRRMSIDDKANLFFNDYQLAPLFVQENYPSVHPFAGRQGMNHHLSLLAHTAESICDGDLVEKLIRQQQHWGLLPVEAMYASVLPGEHMRGNVSHMVSFPKWLGKFSSRNKNERILQELNSHMRLCISGNKRSLNLDYLPCLRQHLTKPLQEHDKDGVPQVIKLMDDYDIIKEDYDNIMEITKWPNTVDYSKSLSSTTKAAFTRAYNKESHMTPYSTGIQGKKRNKSTSASVDFFKEEGEEEAASEEENEDDIDIDSMIKKKKTENKKGKKNEKDNKKTKGKKNGSKS